MAKYRQAAKIDSNQPEIVNSLKSIGASVETNKDDILVGWRGKTFWFEIKDPEKTLNKDGTWRKGAIKPSQIKLMNEWKGQYNVVTSIEQILKVING